jgi:hypothetical protein
MIPGGKMADPQLIGDLFIGLALYQEAQNLLFTWGQVHAAGLRNKDESPSFTYPRADGQMNDGDQLKGIDLK